MKGKMSIENMLQPSLITSGSPRDISPSSKLSFVPLVSQECCMDVEPESALWAVDEEGSVMTLSTGHCGWQRVKAVSKIGHFKQVAASSWCLWALGSDHQIYLMVHGSDVKIRFQEAFYENERWAMGVFGTQNGFHRKNLLRGDHSNLCSETEPHVSITSESLILPSSRWVWEDKWRIQETIRGVTTEKGGWQYAPDFNNRFSSKIRINSVVRRRRWIRNRRFVTLDRWLFIPLDPEDPSQDPIRDLTVGGELVPNQGDGFLVVWVVTLGGKLFYRKGVHNRCPEGVSWHEVTVPQDQFIVSASVGPLGHLWICTDQGAIFVRDGVSWQNPFGTNGWHSIDPPVSPTRDAIVKLGVGVRGVWALGSTGHHWFRRGVEPGETGAQAYCGTRWIEMVGRLKSVSVGPDDQVWALESDTHRLFYRTSITPNTPSGNLWRSLELPVFRSDSRARFGSASAAVSLIGGPESAICSSASEPRKKPPSQTLYEESAEQNDGPMTSTDDVGFPPINVELLRIGRLSPLSTTSIEPARDHSNALLDNPMLTKSLPVSPIDYITPQLSIHEAGTDSEINDESTASPQQMPFCSILSSGKDSVNSSMLSSSKDRFNSSRQESDTVFFSDATSTCDRFNGNQAAPEDTEEGEVDEVAKMSLIIDQNNVEQVSLSTLRWVSASALHLERGIPPLWLRAPSSAGILLSTGGNCGGNQGTRGVKGVGSGVTRSNSDPNFSGMRGSQFATMGLRVEGRNAGDGIKKSVWRRLIMARFKERNRLEIDNPAFADYSPALIHSSWVKTASCRTQTGCTGAGWPGFSAVWTDATLTLEQARTGRNDRAELRLDYHLGKRPVREVLQPDRILCLCKWVTPTFDGPLQPCFALFTLHSRLSSQHNTPFTSLEATGKKKQSPVEDSCEAVLMASDEAIELVETATPNAAQESGPEILIRPEPIPECPHWLIRLSREEDVEDWLTTLTAACPSPCTIYTTTSTTPTSGHTGCSGIERESEKVPVDRAWAVNMLCEPLLGEVPPMGTGHPGNIFWRQVGGHMRQIESGGGGHVTWALGHNGVAWVHTGGRGGQSRGERDRLTRQLDTRAVVTYEYQHWRVMRGYTDRWSDELGRVTRTREQVRLLSRNHTWTSEWRVDFSVPQGCDSEGWQYARDINSNRYKKESFWHSSLRRRRWTREYRTIITGPWIESGKIPLRDISLIPLDDIASFFSNNPRSLEIDVWAVSSQGDVLRRKGVTADKPQGTHWVHIVSEQGRFINVSVSPVYHVWATGEDGSAWLRRGVQANCEGFSWAHVGSAPDNCPLKQISAGGCSNVWAVDVKGRLWARHQVQAVLPEGTEWLQVPTPDPVTSVSCGPGNKIWAVFAESDCIAERSGVTPENPVGVSWCCVLRGVVTYATVRGTLPDPVTPTSPATVD